MIKGQSVRKMLLESRTAETFGERFRSMLIVEDEKGVESTAGASAAPEEFSVRELAESLVGSEWIADLARGDWESTKQLKALGLREATGGLTPGNFSSINAFNLAVFGLFEAKVLASYKRPDFIADAVFTTRPTRTNGGKWVGVGAIGDVAKPVLPGEEFPSVGLPDNWLIIPENVKHGLKLALTREALVYDTTDTLYAEASRCGAALGYRKEVRCADVAQGLVNNYNRKGVPTNTYLTTGAYVNSITNTLVNPQSVDKAHQQLLAQTDPETNLEIAIENGPLVLVPPALAFTAKSIAYTTTLEVLPGGGASGTTRFFSSPGGVVIPFTILSSQIWYNRLLTGGDGGAGAAVTPTNAVGRWLFGDLRQSFSYMEVWPLTVRNAEPSSMEMISKDIVNAWACSEYGVPVSVEPRSTIRNTVE